MKKQPPKDIFDIKFPKQKLNIAKKEKIISNIQSAQPINQSSIDLHQSVILPWLSKFALLIIVIGLGVFTYGQIFSKEHQNAGNIDFYSIQLPEAILIKEDNHGSHLFYKDEQIVGGLQEITNDEKQKILFQSGVFENDILKDFEEPTQRIIIHVKQMGIIQTIHYFIQPAGEKIIYDLYFHANTPGYFGAEDFIQEKDRIHEIAKTFQLK
ncbi:hypothetical protein [Fredinandcohnia quinoae]|uniref:Uncharacterized protein n=1 Tax=Fredinandcohnia quinoae TaxID=2918902 RepID=A0AAW5E988_9BACI|nr:hypothetical protein [Fredinandcohnia sp. SECRCQ15]MCH1627800.1 hypothetical protein [Fredinandcohnia sp. SECRCQ15]